MSSEEPSYDALIVGAGFSGIFLLHHLRKIGLKCKIYEAGTGLGGTWHWHTYPGLCVDSEVPVYEYSAPELWSGWTWTERYPSGQEILRYFDHVDQVWDIKKDVEFGVKVIGAQFNVQNNNWDIKTEDGRTTHSRFFLVAAGFWAKRYIPDFKGLDTFQGKICHSASWPREGIDTKGKRTAIIGTGATGVQLTQALAKESSSLTVFQRTPNLALPMRQGKLTREEQEARKPAYQKFFQNRETTFSGMRYGFSNRIAVSESEEEREALFETLWQNGGFEFWLGTYQDILFDPKANRYAYDFWAKKTRARMTDTRKKDIVAPLDPPHAFGTKRPSLEEDYYEMFNQPNVNVVDLRKNPIVEIKPDGILVSDGTFYPLDVIALATGCDAVSGSMTNMGLRDIDGKPLEEAWKDGAHTYLGMCIKGYPNMFYLYATHGPTAFSNGPSAIEIQGRWIVEVIKKIQKNGWKYVHPTSEAQEIWKEKVNAVSNITLLPQTDSWYMGANIPGKKREQLNYAGGLKRYEVESQDALKAWDGFVVA
ncbi:cyclohexanone 1,2-monooxygenase [Arthroderma uncinatum]|uniref:cyclohexanone 1,2-monooxygenase n=1 Tax=Arthroderma uncinatum TaxID=74035 RepID=UPI00144AD792|nr:cyclohexanone 1,2-monooxygenase [Arthroderma uncinatum]KAF3484061.1 cyclohexanone 1,2-monooxygenase [Arthroderma uncinatum]